MADSVCGVPGVRHDASENVGGHTVWPITASGPHGHGNIYCGSLLTPHLATG